MPQLLLLLQSEEGGGETAVFLRFLDFLSFFFFLLVDLQLVLRRRRTSRVDGRRHQHLLLSPTLLPHAAIGKTVRVIHRDVKVTGGFNSLRGELDVLQVPRDSVSLST